MALIDEILKLPTIPERVEKLKLGRGWRKEPDTEENISNWLVEKHSIKDEEKYPDRKIVVKKGKTITDSKTGKSFKTDDETETQKSNRIAIPIEQDIVNTHVGFGVGLEPSITCDTDDDGENDLLSALKYTMKKNRCKFNNKKEMRSWLAEQEVAEYWYAAQDDDNFWTKILKKMKLSKANVKPTKRMKCAIWSPFRGDKLYPFFEGDDMTGFMREYKKKTLSNTLITCYTVITKVWVYQWESDPSSPSGFKDIKPFKHGFSKIPVLYTYRPQAYCQIIKDMRERLEKTLSSYADCLDYHFFPYLILKGDIQDIGGRLKNHIFHMHGDGASATYLTWNQVPDTIKFEVERYFTDMYALTRTPRISLDNLKGMTAVSGTAFKFYFMGAHLQESNNEEDFGEFLQRRINFLVSALGDMNARLLNPSKSIDVETEMVPYMIDNISDKVTTAIAAYSGGIWSRKHAMIFAGQIEHIDEEIKEIEADEAQKAENKMGQDIQSSEGKTDKKNILNK